MHSNRKKRFFLVDNKEIMLFIYVLAEPTNGSNGSSALLHALLLFVMPMCKELTKTEI